MHIFGETANLPAVVNCGYMDMVGYYVCPRELKRSQMPAGLDQIKFVRGLIWRRGHYKLHKYLNISVCAGTGLKRVFTCSLFLSAKSARSYDRQMIEEAFGRATGGC